MMKFIMPTFLFNIEKWKWNSEYRVFVSNMGHFKDEYKQDIPTKIDRGGYCKIRTHLGYKTAHRLVMFTWRPVADAETLTVDHLDHNKRNNAVSNLEWVTYEENQTRAAKDQLKGEAAAVDLPTVNINIDTINIDIQRVPQGLSSGDIDKQLDNRINYCRYITDGSTIFNNANEAAIHCVKTFNLKDANVDAITRRIIAAVFYKKKYFNTKWYFVEEE